MSDQATELAHQPTPISPSEQFKAGAEQEHLIHRCLARISILEAQGQRIEAQGRSLAARVAEQEHLIHRCLARISILEAQGQRIEAQGHSLSARVAAQDTLIRDLSEQLARLRQPVDAGMVAERRELPAEEFDSYKLWMQQLERLRSPGELRELAPNEPTGHIGSHSAPDGTVRTRAFVPVDLGEPAPVYTIIRSEVLDDLAAQVNDHLRQGWRAQGGVEGVRNAAFGQLYMQAMVKGGAE